ncbi:MAG: FHA domain-containing protein [Planctomycetes bacterium]|nr:FHA domain-containing protein [Planctomycetota bacterium]
MTPKDAQHPVLLTLEGPDAGRQFPCADDTTTVGRQPDCAVCLESPAVSRHHARIFRSGDEFFVEDLGSSNGTFLNGERTRGRQPLTEKDVLQIGPYQFVLRIQEDSGEDNPVIRSQVNVLPSNQSLYVQNAAHKLRVVVEIAQNLGRTLEVKPLLDKLLEQLFRLFPQADRGMVILCEGEQYAVRAQRLRHKRASGLGGPVGEEPKPGTDFPFSRSLVRRALEEGVGLLSEDVGDDLKLAKTATLIALNLRSFLCVPLIGLDQRRLGVLQLDCTRPGSSFAHEDLELLTALSLQVAGVIENAALHEELLREAWLRRELALAREIQESFLPDNFRSLPGGGYELYARVHPAREVSGDLYDFFPLADGRLALFLGDVSGKGMPAALFMIAVHTLTRHLAASAGTPAELLERLNDALVADNPTKVRGGGGRLGRPSAAAAAPRGRTRRPPRRQAEHDARLCSVRAAAGRDAVGAPEGRDAHLVHRRPDRGVSARPQGDVRRRASV